MVGHDDIDISGLCASHAFDGVGSAIDGDNECRVVLFETTLECRARKAVPFVKPVGNKGLYISAKCGKDAGEHRSGGHAVYVIIAENRDGFAGIDGFPDSRNRLPHIGKQEGIG